MEKLITREEVVRLAFASNPSIAPSAIPETAIVTAQEKFVRPVVGRLYERIGGGELPALLDEYIKPALAFYVKLLVLPVVASPVGQTGVVKYRSSGFAPASERELSRLERKTRSNALMLMRIAVAHIESNRQLYPEYEPSENVLNRISTDGGIVL